MSHQQRQSTDDYSKLQQELAQREVELAIINSVQQGLAAHLDVQAIYDLVGNAVRDFFNAQVVMISTYDRQTETIAHVYAIERGQRVYAPGRHPIRGFRTQIVQTRQPVLVNTKVAELAAQLGQPTLPGTITPKSWLGVPMLVGDQVTGILSLQNVEHENAFDESDVRLLQTLAASMSVALENARLWEQEYRYRKALDHEFVIGREIQAGFLPASLPQPEGWEIAATLKSASEVAGDFYDAFDLGDGTTGLVVADVCDKGLGAALFMTLFRSLIRAVSNMESFTHVESTGVVAPATRLLNAFALTNNYIAKTHGNTGMFATIFFGILDTHSGTLSYTNGGHLPPLVIRADGSTEDLMRTGPAVGAVLDAHYAVCEVQLGRGDQLFAYTDGLTDAANFAGEEFDMAAMLPLFAEGQSVRAVLTLIEGKIERHAAGAQQVDDITMLAVKRNV